MRLNCGLGRPHNGKLCLHHSVFSLPVQSNSMEGRWSDCKMMMFAVDDPTQKWEQTQYEHWMGFATQRFIFPFCQKEWKDWGAWCLLETCRASPPTQQTLSDWGLKQNVGESCYQTQPSLFHFFSSFFADFLTMSPRTMNGEACEMKRRWKDDDGWWITRTNKWCVTSLLMCNMREMNETCLSFNRFQL